MRIRLQFGMIALAAVLLGNVAAAEEWKPAEGPLMTRWAKEVSPDNVHPEYPRPQMRRDQWKNLNGLWQYAIRPKGEGRPSEWDGEILVPFPVESALSGVRKRVGAENKLWYRRTFKASLGGPPEEYTDNSQLRGQRMLLHFGAVDWHTIVWVNGKKIGEHRGGYDPFTFDISKALEDSGEQEIVVSVWDPTDEGPQPRGKQVKNPHGIWYTPVTGIWQTVWLEPVPEAYIKSLKITPNVDEGLVNIKANVAHADESDRFIAVVEPEEGDENQGEEWTITTGVNEQGVIEGVVVRGHLAMGRAGEELAVQLPDSFRTWSPDDPFLYQVDVRLLSMREGEPGSNFVDKVQSYFGMRKIEVQQDDQGVPRLFLNNEPLFQYGPLDQGWWPDGLYTPPTDEAIKYDLQVTKQLGFNMARKHVKVAPARWYYWADKMGVLVWQDMPNGDNNTPEGKKQFERELEEMIEDFYNHPSIVMWVPFNEGWGQYDTERIANLVEKWDPTRLVNNASGWTDKGVGDVHDMHKYPGPDMPPVEETRAAVLGEFGGLGLPIEGHTWQDKQNWGYRNFESREALEEAYLRQVRELRPLIGKGLAAAVYTQTSDVEIEVNGLMTYDRAVTKIGTPAVLGATKLLYAPPPIIKTLLSDSRDQPQSWRFTTEKPEKGWRSKDFDDSAWRESNAGFGEPSTPGSVVRTEWKTSDIWLRREFQLEQVPQNPHLRIHHDENAQVYINGKPAVKLEGYTTDYRLVPLSEEAQQALREGRNTIAIHVHQTGGGQYIDAGLVDVREGRE